MSDAPAQLPPRTLSRQVEHVRRQERRLLVVTAAALAAVGLLGYWPARAKLHELDKQSLLAEGEIAENRKAAVQLPRTISKVNSLRSNLAHIRQRELPDTPQLMSFFHTAEGLRDKLSVELEYQQRGDRDAVDYRECDVELSIAGDFVNVYSFLRQLEDLPRLLRVSRLEVTAHPERDGGQVRANVTVTLYYRGE